MQHKKAGSMPNSSASVLNINKTQISSQTHFESTIKPKQLLQEGHIKSTKQLKILVQEELNRIY